MVLGTLSYGVTPATIPSTQDWNDVYPGDCIDLNATQLVPVIESTPPNSTMTVSVTVSFQQTFASGGQATLGYMNYTSWLADTTNPTLLQMYQAGTQTSFSQSQLVVVNDDVQVIDLIMDNEDDSSHPFHLHGHTFWLLGVGNGTFVPGESEVYLNYNNPPRRDTLTVPGYGWMAIRFIGDNPGLWAFHCHIGWHMAAGMLMQFASLPSKVQQFDIPDYLGQQCLSQSGGAILNRGVELRIDS